MVIDLQQYQIHFSKLGRSAQLHGLPSGHVAIDVLDFGVDGFVCPEQAEVDGYRMDEFRCSVGQSNSKSVMIVTPNVHCVSQSSNGVFGSRPLSACSHSAARGCADGRGSRTQAREQSEGGPSQLAGAVGQAGYGAKLGWLGGVSALVAASGDWSGSEVFPAFLRAASRVHRVRGGASVNEVKDGSANLQGAMQSSSGEIEQRGEPTWSLGRVPGLPCQVEDSERCGITQEVQVCQSETRRADGEGGARHERGKLGSREVQQAENGARDSEGHGGGTSDAVRRSVEDDDMCCEREECAGRTNQDVESRATANPTQAASDFGDGRLLRVDGNRPGLSGVQGLSRLGDVGLRGEALGPVGGDSQVRTVAERIGGGEIGERGGKEQYQWSEEGEEELSHQECSTNTDSYGETWLRLSGPGNPADKIKRMQQCSLFSVKELYVEEGSRYFSAEPEELLQGDTCVLKVSASQRLELEELVEEVEEKALSRKQKAALRKAEKQVEAEKECFQVDVSEVYSPPRLVKVAPSMGLKPGKSYDLKCGFDLRHEKDVKAMWKSLCEESPEVILACPPCTPFSLLQELNFPKMSVPKVTGMILEGLHHLRIAAAVCKWQYRHGRVFVFEHPLTSRAWEEPEMQELMCMKDVYVCTTDMCAYGMRVGGGLNQKPTRWITNSYEVARELQRRCNHQHEHVHLMGGKAHGAEVYPKELCRAVLRGVRRHLKAPALHVEFEDLQEIFVGEDEDLEEMLDREVEHAAGRSGQAREVQEEEDASTEEEEEDEATQGMERPRRAEVPQSGVTADDRQKIRRLHVNLGHPSKESFLRFLSAGRIRREVIQWVRKEFQCATCESAVVPKAPRPAVVPRCYTPATALAIDIFFLPDVLNQRSLPVLNILDLGTNYQMIEILHNKDPTHIWQTFWNVWGRTFGMPQYVAIDEGREFRGGFVRHCAAAGIATFRIAARAPWQQGRVERHGGIIKELIEKSRNELPPTSMSELVQILRECECAKNRFSNRSGFSPMQRMTGQWPRMPGSLVGDEEIDPALQAENATDDFTKLMEARKVAQQAFIRHATQTAMGKALHARPRKQQMFKSGDLVYVFRALRKPKSVRGHGYVRGARVTPRARWVGPGSVLAIEGSVVWINMMGELWRAATEQVRLATMDEALGVEIVNEHFEEMKERLKRSSDRAGYRDVSEGPLPPLDDEMEKHEEKMEVQVEELQDPVEVEGEARGRPRPRTETDGEPNVEQPPQFGSSSASVPQDEIFGDEVAEEVAGGDVSRRASTAMEPEVEAPVEEIISSVAQNQRLDGIPSSTPLSEYQARRLARGENMRWRQRLTDPYFNEVEVFLFEDEASDAAEKAEVEEQEKRDYWVFDSHRNRLQRHHVHWRKALFNPMQADRCPVPLRAVKAGRVTRMMQNDGNVEEKRDEWSLFCKKEERCTWWKGITEFEVDEHFLVQGEKGQGTKQKRGEGEVFPHEISPSEWPEWEKEDKAEFEKIVKSGALKVLSVEESNRVREELKSQGKLNRILPSRMVRRYKPGDAPGKPRTKKSRFCIRGDKDPDAIHLNRFAPTVTTSNLQIAIQVARNLGFKGKVGDLKSAFTQSMALCRQEGPLYCKSSHGSMPGLQDGQLCQIILGCYGLMDAPLNWRKTLVQFVTEVLGYRQSVLDPCTYMLYRDSKLRGILAIEVDDLLMFGDDEHEKCMQLLQKRFTFGKIEEIDSKGVNFNGRRLRQVGEDILVDMKAFVEERLQVVELDKRRIKQRDAKLTEEETSRVRSVCGALNWAGREGRPDAAAAASLFSSIMTEMKISDVLELNKAVEYLKKTSDLALRIQPLKQMCWGVISDASYANARGGKTQAGHLLITFEHGLLEGRRVKTNVLHWKSGKLKRVVSSTLAAETQSLARAIGDLLWMMVMSYELLHEDFELRNWREYVKCQGYVAFSKSDRAEDLGETLALVDAKSLYDLLINETTGGSDRRTALDVQALREELQELQGKIRWVDHPHMPADCLTKHLGKSEALKDILESGEFGITEEAATLAKRSDVRRTEGYNRR